MALILDYDKHLAVERDGLPRVAEYDDGIQRVIFLNDRGAIQSTEVANWIGPLPPDPTPQEISAAIAAREAARQAAIQDAAALRQQIQTLAGSAVGVRVDLLTAPQVRALVAILLWQAGALDRTGTVQPLAQWVRS